MIALIMRQGNLSFNDVPREFADFYPLPCSRSPGQRAALDLNILFIIADDASRHFGQAYDRDWEDSNIDKLAEEGLVFDNAYVATAKCAPCRASTMTGRFRQIEAGANHQNVFPTTTRPSERCCRQLVFKPSRVRPGGRGRQYTSTVQLAISADCH